ncbi:MAG: TlpA disulfide reductase family protein [Desulfobulbus sp.]|jgi:thiol-disulfide isomerase/thioredoxin|nr:TlpA disulfide reductase family protein [Desulfobulbus sp.]
MRFRHHFLLPLFLLLCVLVLPAAAPAVQPGQPLLPFKGQDLNGKPFDLAESIGSKPVMLVFWASWCPSCRTEVPKINQLAAKYGERGMAFVAINVGFNDSVERAQAFARKTGMTYPAIFDGSGQITEPYQLIGVPTIIIADNKGVIQYRNFATPEITEEHFSRLNAN